MTARRILHIAAIATVLIGSTTFLVRACGPDFEPDVFIQSSGPANNFTFAKGRLGVLQDSYYIRPKSVAFRYLNGGTLDAAEQAQLASSNDNEVDWQHMTPEQYRNEMSAERAARTNTGPARWSAAALPFGAVNAIGQNRAITIKNAGFNQAEDVLNCRDNAFDAAVATLNDRARRWGKDSPALHDWLTAQNQVFSNCVTPG